jgi:hypothetical protein
MVVESPARPELAAHAHAVRAELTAVVAELREVLGAKLVTYLGSVKETRAVNEWADGTRTPSQLVQRRLRHALQVARMIADADGPAVAQAWFQGLDPQLDDRSPARLLREGDLDEVGAQVLAAARAFMIAG